MNNEKTYYVYIVKCADGTLYTGFTTNIERRLNEHNYSIKKAAKYTRSRRPVSLVHNEEYKTMSEALKREHAIKKLSRKRKIELIEQGV
jgi:putative endonuclease